MAMDDEVEAWLGGVSTDVAPSKRERQKAKRAHKELRELLRTGEMARRIVRSYLSGSYVRHTATSPLNDVDIIFEIEPSRWRTGWFSELPSPEQVLTTFADAIRLRLRACVSMLWPTPVP